MAPERPEPSSRPQTRFAETINQHWLAAFSVVAIVVAAIVLLAVWLLSRKTFDDELPKTLLQLGVVALGGAVIAAVVKSAEHDRDTRERADEKAREAKEKADNDVRALALREAEHGREMRERDAELARDRAREDFEYLMSMFREVTNAYNSIKSVQRTLKAADLSLQPSKLDTQQSALVRQQMEVLEKAQLSLEAQMRTMRVRHRAFGTSVFIRLMYCLRQMEGYTNDVLSDTRKHPGQRKELAKFLGDNDHDGGIREGNAKPYSPKIEVADWKEVGTEPGKGPSAHLRHIEAIVAEALPDGSPIPAELPVA